MIDYEALLYAVLTVSGLVLMRHYWLRGYSRLLRHPPSPRPLPLIGNILSVPSGPDYLAYTKLGEQLSSGIIYMNMMGQPFIILNNAQMALDLLEKRSAIYSNRRCALMVESPTLLDWPNFPAVLPYSDLWRRQRRRMNNWLNMRAVRQFDGLQQDVAKRLLVRLLDLSESHEPFEKMKHQFSFTMAFATFKLAYGYQLKSDQDPFFLDAVQATNNLFSAMMRSNFLVNAFPLLNHVPGWFPGARWKTTARNWREHKDRAVTAPYEWAKQQVMAGTFEPSVLSALLQNNNVAPNLSTEEQDGELKELAFMLFVGGTDTSATALVNFVAAMVVNPEAQAKAQVEIDSILGDAVRLPIMEDEAQLPYVRNLVKEVLRWHPVTATGGEHHVCYKDDVYEGYDIQEGTIIVGNLWAMSRDETNYRDPESFNPDRFLDPKVPELPGFGWGRRKCPGLYFAEASLFLVITSLLATFQFSRKKDKDGKEIIPIVEGAANSLTVPIKPFEFEMRPRSEKHRQLIIDNAPH